MPSVLGRTMQTARFLAADPVLSAKGGHTPHAVIHRQGPAALRYFPPAADTAPRTPVLVSMPLINTWTFAAELPGLVPSRSLRAFRLSTIAVAGKPAL